MKVNRFIVGLLLLMATVVAAQDMQWQSMGGPYYVYDVTGISLGWYGAQMRAYYCRDYAPRILMENGR